MNSNTDDVVVTGLGPVTSIGVGCDELWASLAAGRLALTRRTLPVDVGRTVELPVASMPPVSQVDGLDKHMAFLSQQGLEGYRDVGYALLAIDLALADAGLAVDRGTNHLAMVQAFEAPGIEHTVGKLFNLFSTPPPGDGPPRLYDVLAPDFYNMQPFMYVHLIGKAHGLHGFCTSVHNACASGAAAIETALQIIRSGQADVVIVVGGECFDTAVRLEWFRRLDMYACNEEMRPFDAESAGFYVGEGAAALVLESAAHAAARDALPYASYSGGTLVHQGWKQAIPDVRSERLAHAITEALHKTGTRAEDLDLVVPHGASTNLSDGYERTCIASSLADGAKEALATVFKPYVGHMLAASTLIDSICSLLAIRHQAVPATPRTRAQDARLPMPLATELIERPVRTVLKLSTGFTGHDAATLFRRV
jgi:3-oxoacyl-[acyl-carrier-protein] synthase II